MNRYFVLILIVVLLIAGCNKADIKPIETDVEEAPVVDDMPEVPEEWEGKTMAEILESDSTSDTLDDTIVINDTEENETEPKEVLPSGVTKISLQMYGEQMQFFPNTVTISKGETVRWVNELDYHDKKARVSVYAKHNSLFRSSMLNYGESFEYQFNETGEYLYGAVPYESFFKNGKVIVE